jgi:hypothetical protein
VIRDRHPPCVRVEADVGRLGLDMLELHPAGRRARGLFEPVG